MRAHITRYALRSTCSRCSTGADNMVKTTLNRGVDVDTPTKAQISRVYQTNGGDRVHGAATLTARAFNMCASSGARDVRKYDCQIRDGLARRRNAGTCSTFGEALAEKMCFSFSGKRMRRGRTVLRIANSARYARERVLHANDSVFRARYVRERQGDPCCVLQTRRALRQATRDAPDRLRRRPRDGARPRELREASSHGQRPGCLTTYLVYLLAGPFLVSRLDRWLYGLLV